MSLIEKYGSYDKAKELLDRLKRASKIQFGGMLSITLDKIDELSLELFEYRRQHNIFEVGDRVIKTHPKNTILWPVLGVYKNGGVWLDYKGFCWKPPRVRHATDEEIKAGHRLDLEVLHDHDIPPNTIVVNK